MTILKRIKKGKKLKFWFLSAIFRLKSYYRIEKKQVVHNKVICTVKNVANYLRLHRGEWGFDRHSLYCTKCRNICWSMITYLLSKPNLYTHDEYLLISADKTLMLNKRYFIIDQQIERHLANYSECLYDPHFFLCNSNN